MGSDIKSNVLTTILLKKLGVPYVIARANDELHGSILEKIGADTVVYLEREMGTRLAQGITLSHVSDYMAVARGYGIARMKVPPNIVGQKLSELGFGPKGKWEVAVLILQREKEIMVNPSLKEVIEPDDILIVAGNHDKLEKLLFEVDNGKEKEK
jgi:trk system potassium uptake protein TrkA